MSFAPMGARRSRGSREGKRTHPLLHLARDDKERASFIDEQRIDGALGIALFFSPFLSASSDPFVRNFFVRTEPLAESNPVPQDPISAIHPPCIYAGDVASAMGFGLCRSKMMNGIVALHSPLMRKDAAEKNGTLFRSVGCVGSRITSELFTLKFKDVGAKCYPALLLRSNRSLLMLLRRRFFAFSSLWTRALVDTGREQRSVSFVMERKIPLLRLFTAGANTVVSDQDQEPIRIWILTCRWFLTVGILPGSWWAHHELGGGWWFRDPVENASFMPRGFFLGSDVHSSRSSESWIERVLVSDTETSSYDPNCGEQEVSSIPVAGEAQTTVVEQAGPSGIAFPAPPTDVVNLDNLPYQWIRDHEKQIGDLIREFRKEEGLRRPAPEKVEKRKIERAR
ncbi:UNVERIFIED_CONTAM: putative cytochrome c biosynthesis protein [Sesamum calycinum]|uniref:Cytochrome c biosynthesis protein n=1 Tax=Sesamum calycinum TaxID=2727403 RepID=A0AAW2JF06_9LAMI